MIQLFKDHGYFVINNSAYSHLPGLPDLLIMKKKTFHLIELKVLKKETQKLGSVFQKTQIPFYLDFLNCSQNLWVIFYLGEICYLVRLTKYIVKNIKKLRLVDLYVEGIERIF